jgi:hypothetical protein
MTLSDRRWSGQFSKRDCNCSALSARKLSSYQLTLRGEGYYHDLAGRRRGRPHMRPML